MTYEDWLQSDKGFDPYLQNAAACMSSWLLLESVFCSCGDHPDSKDPYCLWCENDE